MGQGWPMLGINHGPDRSKHHGPDRSQFAVNGEPLLALQNSGRGRGQPPFHERFGGGTGLGQKLTSRPKKQDLIEEQVHCVHFEGHSVPLDSAITQQMSSVNEGVCHPI